MEGKKISFSFKKTNKVEKLQLVQEKKDYIECVEEKSIKVIGGDEVKEIAPLVIPMKPNTLITTERLKEIAEKVESALEEPETTEEPPKPLELAPENETLDQMAVRELLEDSKNVVKVETPQLSLLLPAKSVASGEKESTLDDYDNVPVQEFGLAMLRGMGWTKTNNKSTFKPPQLRPKGLGLGADKVVKDKQKTTKNSKDEELTIVKNAFVKITNGKYSGYYGKVLSLDEDNGRVMLDITVKKETVSLSEFMMHPVTKSEFDKESKVINANSFEQYKKNEGLKSSKISEKESSSRSDRSTDRKDGSRDEKVKRNEENNAGKDNSSHWRAEKEKPSDNKDRRERNRDRSNREKHRDGSDEKYKNRRSKRDSSQDLSDSDAERKHKKEEKSKKHYSSMESLNSDSEKRDKKKERRDSSDSEADRNKRTNKEQKRHDSDKVSNRDKERKRHDSNLEDRKSKKEHRRYSSDSESDHRVSKKNDKDRRRHDSDTDHRKSKRSDSPEGKRDIDKKRKGKKKKRDRDRSPNYRKHRK